MRVLALEPFYGGSHRAFLDGWRDYSRHQWTILGLPPHHWKWRMRHSAITLAREVERQAAGGAEWDILVAGDMLNLAEFKGLADGPWRALPTVLYFHENQLTYPSQVANERDLHLAYTNFTSAMTAEAVWFNSEFHRSEFLSHFDQWLTRMPDYTHRDELREIEYKSRVEYPGIIPAGPERRQPNGQPVLVWPARWEHDKNPELLAAAITSLAGMDLPFHLRLLGQAFPETPPTIEALIDRLGPGRVDATPVPDRQGYLVELRKGDIVVSTAVHEFFGLAILEAISAGCYPVLPNRLAYPEVMGLVAESDADRYLYDGTETGLVERLEKLIRLATSGELWRPDDRLANRAAELFGWETRAGLLDDALDEVAG